MVTIFKGMYEFGKARIIGGDERTGIVVMGKLGETSGIWLMDMGNLSGNKGGGTTFGEE